MKIAHIALWTKDLERLRSFYETYFKGKSSGKYVNEKKGFASYFVTFEGATALEIMQRVDISSCKGAEETIGLAHFAFEVESRGQVDNLIELFRKKGHRILGEPRLTGDGFYEGVLEDPDGNRIELVSS